MFQEPRLAIYKDIILFNLHNYPTNIGPILQMKKLRYTEAQWFVQSHTQRGERAEAWKLLTTKHAS